MATITVEEGEMKDDIFDSILFCDALCSKAEIIFNLVKNNRPKNPKEKFLYINDTNIHCLQLVANLFVNQCVIEVGNLLDSDGRQKTLYELTKNCQKVDEAKKALDEITKKFKDKKLLQIRHQFVAHRSKNSKGSPVSLLFSTYKKDHIESCREIIDNIITFWINHIGPRPGNNIFIDKLEGVDKLARLAIENTFNLISKKEMNSMKTLVIYDSSFGNTKRVAEEIGKNLGHDVKVIFVNDFKKADLEGVELLIVGGPINAWRPTMPMMEFLNSLGKDELKGIKATTFDTRVKLFIHGDAKDKIAGVLEKAGAEIIIESQAFYVKGKEGPLFDGELKRAEGWAKEIARKL